MLIETGLLRQFNLISEKSWGLTGIPYEWTGGNMKVNRRNFLSSSLIIGAGGLAFISRSFHFFKNLDEDGNTSGLVFMLGVAFLFFANVSFVIFLEPELLKGFLPQMVSFERRHVQSQPASWRERQKGKVVHRVALLTCQLVNEVTLRGCPPLFGLVCMIWPEILFNVAGTYRAWLGTGWGAWLGHRMWLLGWTTLGWYCAIRVWAIFAGLVILGCCGMVAAILAFERTFPTEPVKEGVVIYRQVQLLCSLFNRFVSSQLVLLPAMAGVVQVFCGRSLLAQDGPPMGIVMKLFFSVAILNSVVAVLFIFGFCGDVHDTSEKCRRRIRSRLGGRGLFIPTRRMREVRRVIPSLQIISVRFGSVNFIEKVTPVVFQQFFMLRLVDCLLVDRST